MEAINSYSMNKQIIPYSSTGKVGEAQMLK